MGFLRYIVQGIGWEIGREAASEGLSRARSEEPAPSKREQRKQERARKREERRAAATAKRQQARRNKAVDQELDALKRGQSED